MKDAPAKIHYSSHLEVKIDGVPEHDGEIFIHCNLCTALIVHYQGVLAAYVVENFYSQAAQHCCN